LCQSGLQRFDLIQPTVNRLPPPPQPAIQPLFTLQPAPATGEQRLEEIFSALKKLFLLCDGAVVVLREPVIEGVYAAFATDADTASFWQQCVRDKCDEWRGEPSNDTHTHTIAPIDVAVNRKRGASMERGREKRPKPDINKDDAVYALNEIKKQLTKDIPEHSLPALLARAKQTLVGLPPRCRGGELDWFTKAFAPFDPLTWPPDTQKEFANKWHGAEMRLEPWDQSNYHLVKFATIPPVTGDFNMPEPLKNWFSRSGCPDDPIVVDF